MISSRSPSLSSPSSSLPQPQLTQSPLPRQPKSKSKPSIIATLAPLAGNVLEWYDFSTFGYFSLQISRTFFPSSLTPTTKLIFTFLIFGLAFLARPIGGVLSAYLARKYGNRKALVYSIYLMAGPTFTMGLLPGYDQIGVWSLILLALTRVLQGLSVGGQLVTSAVYSIEKAEKVHALKIKENAKNNDSKPPKQHLGYIGGTVMASANFGTLLGGVVCEILREVLDKDDLESWGWRLPFLSGVCVVVFGVYLDRAGGDDDAIVGHHNPSSSSSSEYDEDQSFKNILKKSIDPTNLPSTVRVFLISSVFSSTFYIYYIWFPTYLSEIVSPPVPNAFLINSISLLLGVCVAYTACGMVSDYVGRKRLMLVGGACLCIFAPLSMYIVVAISESQEELSGFLVFALITITQTTLGVFLSMFAGPMLCYFYESFPAPLRLTSISLAYNLAQALIGGSSPSLATWLVSEYGDVSPGYLVSFYCLLGWVGVWSGAESKFDEGIRLGHLPAAGSLIGNGGGGGGGDGRRLGSLEFEGEGSGGEEDDRRLLGR